MYLIQDGVGGRVNLLLEDRLRFQDIIKTKLETETGNWKVEKRHLNRHLKQRLHYKESGKINYIIDVRRLLHAAFEDKGKYLLSI